MNKLINTYRKCPSPANLEKVQRYIKRHMMAICLASKDDIAFLKTHEFKI